MSSADFTYLTLRNLTAYNPNGSYVSTNYVLTASTFGTGVWTNKLILDSLTTTELIVLSTMMVDNFIANFVTIHSSLSVSTVSSNLISSLLINTSSLSTNTSYINFLTYSTISGGTIFGSSIYGSTIYGSTIFTNLLIIKQFLIFNSFPPIRMSLISIVFRIDRIMRCKVIAVINMDSLILTYPLSSF